MTGDELARRLADDSVSLVDVRTPPEYSGAAGYPCDPRQGHIEGAANVPVDDLFGDDGRPLADEAMRALLAERGVAADRPIVTYCHSGQRSEIAASALRSAGLEAENYPGSWHEWSRRSLAKASGD